MTEHTITLDIPALAACLKLAAKKDVRYYLNGVLLAPAKDARVGYVGTDGHALIHCADADGEPWPAGAAPIIVPRDFAASVVKLGAKGKTVTLAWSAEPRSVTNPETGEPVATMSPALRAACGPVSIDGESIDGRFPDWRNVIGAAENIRPSLALGASNAKLLARLLDAMATASHAAAHMAAPIRLGSSGTDRMIAVGAHAIGVAMGYRDNLPELNELASNLL